MAIELLFGMFIRAQLAATLGVLLVMALRLPVRRFFSAELAYALWLLGPAAALGSLFPALPEYLSRAALTGVMHVGRFVDWQPVIAHASILASVWAVGAVAFAAILGISQLRFEARARRGRAGPAATGVWPRMVVPSDYANRFTPEERLLIRAHERVHMARRDPVTNLLIAFCQTLGWPNPLMHLAAHLARLDQELSVDARVIAQHATSRRRYAETLLKAHAHGFNSPLACALAAGSRHPLEVRLARLGLKPISVRRDCAGAFSVGLLVIAAAGALWAFAPI